MTSSGKRKALKNLVIIITGPTSGSDERRVTSGGANFLVKTLTNSASLIISIYFIKTFTADNTTAALACAKRGVIRSHILY